MDGVSNILVVGVGGLGVMTAAEILAEAAVALGHEVKKAEFSGVARRGGEVSAHLRFGPRVLSPQIAPGSADILLGIEAAEAMRWQHMLRPGGIALINRGRLVPPVVELGLYAYPDDPAAEVRAAGVAVRAFDASQIASSLGDAVLANTVLLGASVDHLPFPAELLLAVIDQHFSRQGATVQAINRQAFAAGRAAAGAAPKGACVAG
jgi:indolepyruvate ferredoxin oxidoreductase, beta subunit